MKIYTKTGDEGETGLFGGERVRKDSARIEAYGAVDELNSILGVVRALRPPREIDRSLGRVQNTLFELGADLATRNAGKRKLVPRIRPGRITELERAIDRIQKIVPPLKAFVLPGGNLAGAFLHYSRTVCRRAEVLTVRLSNAENVNRDARVYLNRLSDFLFVLARYANYLEGLEEVKWRGRPSQQ